MANETSVWLDFALQQLAAESHLDGIDDFSRIDLVEAQLVDGVNRFDAPVPLPTEHPTRMVAVQAEAFTDRYEIVDHQPNDASGFSATLLQKKDTSGNPIYSYTLAMRSTEFRDRINGGDFERDGAVFDLASGTFIGADGELAETGFALGQLASMEAYYAEVKELLPPGAKLNVTGYSLSGHLATVFTELHTADVEHTYIFNGAGRGDFDAGVGGLAAMIAYYRDVRADPSAGLIPDELDPYRSAWEAAMAVTGQPMPSDDESLYLDVRHQWALIETNRRFDTLGLLDSHEVSARSGIAAEAAVKITQLFGHATHDDQEIVANSGINASPTSVFIEDQPDITGGGGLWGLAGNFGTTHSIVLIVDSLSVMNAFQAVDANLERSDIESIFAAASASRAENSVLPVGRAEVDSLELALDALRKIILGPDAFVPTPFLDGTLGFGDLPVREQLHQNIRQLQSVAATSAALSIRGIASVSAADLATRAETSLAYRHALLELNPFVVEGDETLYAPFNLDGRLDGLSAHYIEDRAEFLFLTLAQNTDPEGFDAAVATERFFKDRSSGQMIGASGGGQPQVRFGTGRSEVLTGGGGGDHLYGGDGADALFGSTGDDLLDGGAGEDVLDGGVGDDTYQVTPGDTVIDSDGVGRVVWDDIQLASATRISTTPYFRTDDGELIYHHSGGVNTLEVTQPVQGGVVAILAYSRGELGITLAEVAPAPTTVNVLEGTAQADTLQVGSMSYPGPYELVTTYEGADVVNVRSVAYPGVRVSSGAGDDIVRLGVEAAGTGELANPDEGASVETGLGNDFVDGGPGADTVEGGDGHDSVFGNAGEDVLVGQAGNDWLDGHADRDAAFGVEGSDVVLGGAGDDFLAGGAGNDEIYGDAAGLLGVWDGAAQTIHTIRSSPVGGAFAVLEESSAAGNDILEGGEGLDRLFGGAGDDLLRGGAGSDRIEGEAGNDVLDGGADADVIYGDRSSQTYESDNTLLFSGTADDGNSFTLIFRRHQDVDEPAGNDVLRGGTQEDMLFGQDGNDELDGGRDDDMLEGGLGDDTYIFERGGGSDTVFDLAGTDHIRFGGGIAPLDLALSSRDGALELRALDNGTTGGAPLPMLSSDALSVLHWDDPAHRVESISFADGTVWETAGHEFDLDDHDLSQALRTTGASGVTTYRLDPTVADGFDLTVEDTGGRDTLSLERVQLDLPPELGPKYITPEIESIHRAGRDLVLDVFMRSDVVGPEVRGQVRLFGHYTDSGWIETIVTADGVLGYPNNAPTVVRPLSDVAVGLDAPFEFDLPGNVFEDDLLDVVTIRAELANGLALPSWLSFDPMTRRFTGLATAEQTSVWPIAVTATDRGELSATTSFELKVGNPDIAPHVNQALPNLAARSGTHFWFKVPQQTFTDENADDTLNLMVTLSDHRPLPAWLDFDAGTNELTGTPGKADEGLFELEVLATDPSGLTATAGFVLAVVPDMPAGETLVGTGREDVLEAFDTSDLILGLGGSDEILGFGGDDIIDAGPGDDLVIAGHGEDLINGAAGNDDINGNSGRDSIHGGMGNDSLFGQGDDDLLEGGEGDDLLVGGRGGDRLIDVEGNDRYVFSEGFGIDVVHDHGGIDAIAFSSVAGVLSCDDGFCDTPEEVQGALELTTVYRVGPSLAIDLPNENRVLVQDWFSAPDYTIERFEFWNSDSMPFMQLGPTVIAAHLDRLPSFSTLGTGGNDVISAATDVSSLSRVVFALSGDDTIEGRGPNRMVAFGGEGHDRIKGSQRPDDLMGGAGDDYLIGYAGNDTIVGGPGDDILTGSPDVAESFVIDRAYGNDTYVFEAGDGSDFLLDPNGANHLQFAAGISTDNVTVRYVAGPERDYRASFDLAIQYGTADRVVTPFWALSWLDELVPAYGLAEGQTRISDETTYGFGDGKVLNQKQLLDLVDTAATSSADVLVGTAGADILSGGEGDDFVFALAGHDRLSGGEGDDHLYGGDHDDRLSGGGGDDVLKGGPGADELTGGSGADLLDSGLGTGSLSGGAGDDVFLVGGGETYIVDSGGFDTLEFSYAPNLTLPADEVQVLREGDDLVINVAGSTRVEQWFASPDNEIEVFRFPVDDGEGGSIFLTRTGDDISASAIVQNTSPVLVNPLLDQSARADAMFSFELPGNVFADPDDGDLFSLDAAQANGNELPSWIGFDAQTRTFSGTPTMPGEVEILVTATDLGGLSASDSFNLQVSDSNLPPRVLTPIGPRSAAEQGAFHLPIPFDTFIDPDDNPLALSAGGADGGVLPAWMHFDEATNTLSGLPPPGGSGDIRIGIVATDNGGLSVTDSFTLSVVEGGPLTGSSGDDVLVGTLSADRLAGRRGADVMYGGFGDDELNGASGDDTLYGDHGNDDLIGGAGADLIVGGPGDDTVSGNSQADRLDGGAGNDTVRGNSGNDYLFGGEGDDALDGGAGADVLTGDEGVDFLRGGGGADTLNGGAGDDVLEGGSAADILNGGSGDDVLNGGAGADALTGGLGRDRLIGGRGSDSYSVERGGGHDTLVEFGGRDDVLRFGDGITKQQLWLTRLNDDLHVDIVGSPDGITVEDWYLHSRNRLESIQTDDGAMLLESQVARLVDAMAAFAPPAATDVTLPQELFDHLAPVIAATWQTS